MSEANAEIIRRAYEQWNSGDMDGLLLAPDLVMSTPPDWPDAITSARRDEAITRLGENRALFEATG